MEIKQQLRNLEVFVETQEEQQWMQAL